MKKSIITLGSLFVVIPPLIGFGIGGAMKKEFNGLSDFNLSRSSIDLNFSNLSYYQETPKGEMVSVTYYAPISDNKERIVIHFDSNTKFAKDACFLMVSIYSSKGDLEHRVDNIIVEFISFTYYVIEFDPPKLENETYREVRVISKFYSNGGIDQYLEFNIPYNKEKEYSFEDSVSYTADIPVGIRYMIKSGEVIKLYEKFDFDSICNLTNQKPIFDIEKLGFKYFVEADRKYFPHYSECYLLIDNIYDNSDMDVENGMKKIPLEIYIDETDSQQIKFKLKNKYYYDSTTGMIYENNKQGRNEVSSLLLPATFEGANELVYYELHFNDFGANKDKFIMKSYATFENKWFGSCSDSYFCVESKDEILDDVYYSGGVTV